MSDDVRPKVDEDACIVCGACVDACKFEVMKLRKRHAQARGVGECIVCGHCVAVCPQEAITHPALDGGQVQELPQQPAVSYEQLRTLLRQRRSVRQYTDEPVPRDLIRELIGAAILAPSGHNAQSWRFTVIQEASELDRVRAAATDFYRRLLGTLDDEEGRRSMIEAMGGDAVEALDDVAPAARLIVRAHERGDDHLLWGAPTLLLVHGPELDPTGAESAHYAAGNLMLAAVTKGLGSCLIGFLTIPARFDAALQQALRLPPGDALHTALVLGWPDVTYLRSTARREPEITFV